MDGRHYIAGVIGDEQFVMVAAIGDDRTRWRGLFDALTSERADRDRAFVIGDQLLGRIGRDVGLVDDDQLGTCCASIRRADPDCSDLRVWIGGTGVDDVNEQIGLRHHLSVLLNAATSPWAGVARTPPCRSPGPVHRREPEPSGRRVERRERRISTRTPAWVSRSRSVDFPAFVYPTIDTLARPLRRGSCAGAGASAAAPQLVLELRDPALDPSPVDLVRLATTEAGADAAALLREVCAGAAAILGRRYRRARARPAPVPPGCGLSSEYVEDHRRAVRARCARGVSRGCTCCAGVKPLSNTTVFASTARHAAQLSALPLPRKNAESGCCAVVACERLLGAGGVDEQGEASSWLGVVVGVGGSVTPTRTSFSRVVRSISVVRVLRRIRSLLSALGRLARVAFDPLCLYPFTP